MNAQSKRRVRTCVALTVLIPLLSTVMPIGAVFAEDQPAGDIRKREPYADFIAEAAQRFELPAAWIRAVMRAESDGAPRALSPKGAIGLMQVMPETWAEIRIRHHLGDDPYDPHDNIIAGSAYIRQLFDRYGSTGWIAAYNAGPGRYKASLKGSPLPTETRAYVAAVAQNLVGGNDAGAAATPTTDPPSWVRASLFVVQPERTRDADPLPNEPARNDRFMPAVARDVSAIVPQSSGLFVARADSGPQP